MLVFDRFNNVPGHAISHSVSVILLRRGHGESSIVNWPFLPMHPSCKCQLSRWRGLKCKLAFRRKAGHRLERKARWVSKYGTNGSIWKGKNEALIKLIAQRGRIGFLLGLELKKIAVDSNFAGKNGFLVRLVQDLCQIALTSLEFVL